MFGWSIKLFRIRGIQLAVHWSFVFLLAAFAWEGYSNSGTSGAVWACFYLVAFFACIVLHELGHSFTGMHYGIRVRRILLMPIGGMAEFDRIPRLPRQELLITVAGPAVNFVIAGLLWLPTRHVASPLDNLPSYAPQFFPCLRDLNLWIGLFNLIPAFPMDGGRIARALLAYGLPYPRATFWAATLGKVVCVAGIIWALSQRNVFAVALFLFIAGAGEAEYRTILTQERRKQEILEASTTLSREPHDLHPGHN